MLLKFISSNNLDFHNYSIFLNHKKVKLNETLNVDLEDKKQVFTVKTYWFKTKEYKLETNHKSCTVKIENFLSKKMYLFIISIFAFLIAICFIFDYQFIWNITVIYAILWLTFQLYMYSFGMKHYIKIKIEYT